MKTTTTNISARIVAKLSEGQPIDQAIDSILGPGEYARIAGELYDTFRAKPNHTTPPSTIPGGQAFRPE